MNAGLVQSPCDCSGPTSTRAGAEAADGVVVLASGTDVDVVELPPLPDTVELVVVAPPEAAVVVVVVPLEPEGGGSE